MRSMAGMWVRYLEARLRVPFQVSWSSPTPAVKGYGCHRLEKDLERPLIFANHPAVPWSPAAFSHPALALGTTLRGPSSGL